MITLNDLREIRYLKMEASHINRQIMELKKMSLTDMSISQKTECAAAVTELIGNLQIRCCEIDSRLQMLLDFIDDIKDDFVRDLFAWRFIQGVRWRDISRHCENIGWYYSEDGLKKIVCRYLKKRNRENGQGGKEDGPYSVVCDTARLTNGN